MFVPILPYPVQVAREELGEECDYEREAVNQVARVRYLGDWAVLITLRRLAIAFLYSGGISVANTSTRPRFTSSAFSLFCMREIVVGGHCKGCKPKLTLLVNICSMLPPLLSWSCGGVVLMSTWPCLYVFYFFLLLPAPYDGCHGMTCIPQERFRKLVESDEDLNKWCGVPKVVHELVSKEVCCEKNRKLPEVMYRRTVFVSCGAGSHMPWSMGLYVYADVARFTFEAFDRWYTRSPCVWCMCICVGMCWNVFLC